MPFTGSNRWRHTHAVSFASKWIEIDGVSEVYSVTGPMDFIAMVRAREHDELAEIVTGRIGQVPGVLRTDTHVAFKMYSRHDLESLFSIGAEQPAKRE